MSHLWKIWLTPKIEITALDEMLMAAEFAALMFAAFGIWLLIDKVTRKLKR